jgi:hypothetical protein
MNLTGITICPGIRKAEVSDVSDKHPEQVLKNYPGNCAGIDFKNS